MPLKAMYNKYASTYDIADLFGAITNSHEIAIDQITKTNKNFKPDCKILDLGVGNGLFLKRLHNHLPQAIFTGIDISSEMLKIASQKLNLKVIEASAADACHFLPHHSQNLVLAHFINAYIPINTLFNQANLLTKANGYFSLITTTYDSFPVAQKNLADFIAKESILSRIVGHYYKTIVKNSTVASSQEELLQTFHNHGFTVIEHTRIKIPIIINNVDELAQFGIEGTWFLNTLSIRILPKHFLIQRLKRLFDKIFEFPYKDTHIIDIVLAKK